MGSYSPVVTWRIIRSSSSIVYGFQAATADPGNLKELKMTHDSGRLDAIIASIKEICH
jgi:hypothetical protein